MPGCPRREAPLLLCGKHSTAQHGACTYNFAPIFTQPSPMAMHLRRVLFVAAVAVTASLALALAAPTPRQVSCTGTKKIIPPAGLRAYQTFFREFNSTTLEGMNAGNVNFEARGRFCRAMFVSMSLAHTLAAGAGWASHGHGRRSRRRRDVGWCEPGHCCVGWDHWEPAWAVERDVGLSRRSPHGIRRVSACQGLQTPCGAHFPQVRACDRASTRMCDTGVGAEPPRTSSWRSASWTT